MTFRLLSNEAIPEAILNLCSRLSITVTSPVVLPRDFLLRTTDNYQKIASA